jgi:hypothetical protein
LQCGRRREIPEFTGLAMFREKTKQTNVFGNSV